MIILWKWQELWLNWNLPISWITPAGLEITQEYALSKKHPISIGFGSKSKTMTYQELLNKTDNRKQPQAIIPNIITHLMQVILLI